MAKTPKKAKRTPNAAFMKPVTPDETLGKVVGDKPLPRTELTKKLWAYIRKNGLQDAKKKTLINADGNLKAVFNGKKQVLIGVDERFLLRILQPILADVSPKLFR